MEENFFDANSVNSLARLLEEGKTGDVDFECASGDHGKMVVIDGKLTVEIHGKEKKFFEPGLWSFDVETSANILHVQTQEGVLRCYSDGPNILANLRFVWFDQLN